MTIPRWHGYSFSIRSHNLLDVSKHSRKWVENEIGSRIKCLRFDNSGEFTLDEFNKYCEEHGIKRQFSVAKMPQQNGFTKRKYRSVINMDQTTLNESKLNDKFWGHVVHTVVHILNRGLIKNKNDKTPYELWTGRAASVRHLRIFGSKCYIKREDKKIENLTLE